MNQGQSFGAFVRQKRREMDLTQEELARRVGCAAITLRKIEADDLRASVQIAERLAMALAIPLERRSEFVRLARAVKPEASDLPTATPPPTMEEIGRDDLTGRAIRGYALAERIGMGGFGSVYRAVQPNVEREVAIKIILPAFANHPDFIRRFEAEAQLVARLEHPHIVPLYDYWREPGVAYLVMRLLRGGSLQGLIRQGPLTIESVARMLEQICLGLHAAHRIGIVHRDLKPANVLLDEDANIYLADFGIAKNLGDPDYENFTQANAILGSPQYMSPEQIQSLSVRPQTDIYCLGVMLYEMLSGTLPFSGPTPFDLIQQHINMPMPPLSAHRAGLPAALDEVITRATAKDPEQRYPDAPTLYQDFLQAVGRMITAPAVAVHFEETSELEIANPFKGLRAFNEADAALFFGRETLVQQLLARLGEGGDLSRFLAVIGPSGSGKSSVVKAGLIPALRRGGLPGSENWFIVDMLPGKHPFEELEAALLRVAVNPPNSLLAQLKDGPRGLLRAVHRILPADPAVELALVIDQFEEIFTLLEDENERALLLENLAAAVMDERSRLRVIITLRADFTDKPLRYVDFGEMMNRRFEFVLPLNADEVERAVAGPAQQVGLRLERGLVSAIIREAGNQPGTLPLLQYALSELFERREDSLLTNQAYREIGGVLGALGRSAEALYASLEADAQTAARQLFLRLVTLGEGTEDTRRRVLRSELENLDARQAALEDVIERFGHARLLTFDHDPHSRGATVEVAHEALLREWKRLHDWVQESRGDVRMQRQLAAAAQEWQAAHQETSFLLTGSRLEQFEGWAGSSSVNLTQAEQAFLSASVQERDQRAAEENARQQRELASAQRLAETERQRAEEQMRAARQLKQRAVYLAGALAAALLLAAAAIFFGRQAQVNSQLAFSRELAAASIANLDVDPERSMLLALAALETRYTYQAEDALHRAILAARLQLTVAAHEPGAPMMAAFSPDGQTFVSGSADETVKVWDTASGEKRFDLDGHYAAYSPDGQRLAVVNPAGIVTLHQADSGQAVPLPNQVDAEIGVAFSPDGQFLATVTQGSLPTLWDAATGEAVRSFPGHTDFVSEVSFSPDGARLLSISDDGAARVWEIATGKELLRLEHPDWVQGAAFSPDGTRLVTVSGELGYVWDAAAGERVLILAGHQNTIRDAAYSPDGSRIATASLDGKIRLWDAATGEEHPAPTGQMGGIYSLAFHPSKALLLAASESGAVAIWNITPGREFLSLDASTPAGGQAAFSPDSTALAAAVENGGLQIWGIDSQPAVKFTLPQPADPIRDAVYSADGKHLFSAQGSLILTWDARTGSAVASTSGHTGTVNALAVSADGKTLVSAGDDFKAFVWGVGADGSPQTLLLTLEHTSSVLAAAIQPQGSQLATGSADGNVRLWEASTAKPLTVLRGHSDAVLALAYHPDGQRLATASADASAKIWDTASGEELLTLKGHSAAVTAVAFSPDGARVATASRDGMLKLWDAATGEETMSLESAGAGLNEVQFSPDGRLLAAGGDDGLQVYYLNIQDLVELARSRLTRTLTSEECQKYLHQDQTACAPAAALPTTTPIPPTDLGRVCQVTNTGDLFDDSFNEQIYNGLQEAHARFGWDTRVLQSSSTQDYSRNIQEFLRGDCDLIVGLFQMADAMFRAAESASDRQFMMMDYVYDQPLDNIQSTVFATDQAAFLAGYAAAAVTQTGKVGVFGGIDFPPVTDFMDGFALGVAYYNQRNAANVQVLGWDPASHSGLFSGGFCCAAQGRQITQQLLEAGADIILPVAGTNLGAGALYAVKAHGNAFVIGVDTDWTLTEPEYGDIILTSIVKNYAVSVTQAVESIEAGTFTGGVHVGTLESGEVGLAPFYQHETLISAQVRADLEEIERGIIAEEIATRP